MKIKEISVQDFIDILDIRCNLIYGEDHELMDLYNDKDIYLQLIPIIENLILLDDGIFAMLDEDITRRIYTLLNLKRFEIRNTHPYEFNLINKIIIRLNEIKSIPEDEKYVSKLSYMLHQSKKRNLEFYDYNTFLASLGTDALFIDYLEGEEIPEDIPDELIIGSIVYLKNYMPNLFELEEVQEKVDNIFEKIQSTSNEISLKRKTGIIKQKVLKR